MGYTAGDHIVLADGDAGQRALLAHELAHVAQRGAEPLPGAAWRIAPRSDPLEAAAGAAAQQALRGQVAHVVAGPVTRGRIYRQQPGGTGGPPPPAPRRIHLDTSVIDQLNRGNATVAAQLKALQAQGAEISVSAPTEVELTLRGANQQIRAANRLLIEEPPPHGLGLRRVSGGAGLAERVAVYERQALTGASVQAKDMPLVEAAARDGAELWTFDTNLLSQRKSVEKHLNVTLAPESGAPVQGTYDYARARRLMGLDPVSITVDGEVIRPRPGGGGGGRGGPGEPPEGGGRPGGPAGESETPGGGARGSAAEASETAGQGRARSRTARDVMGPQEAAPPGFRRQLGFAALTFVAGVGTSLLQSAFRDKVKEDLAKLSKPRGDARGANEFLRDPATRTAVRLLDVLSTDLTPFTAELQPQHERIMLRAELEVLAMALLSGATSADIERRFARLAAIQEELDGYDEQLSIVQENLDAAIELEPAAMETKRAADSIRANLEKLAAGQAVASVIGVAPPPDVEDYAAMDSNLAHISASIRLAFRDAHVTKAAVDKAIAEETALRDQLRKIWWNEFAAQLQRLTKERAQASAAQAAPPPAVVSPAGVAPPRPTPGPLPRIGRALNADQRGTLAMLRTRVSQALFQLGQTEAKLGASPTREKSATIFQEREELLQEYREANARLQAFKTSVGASDED